MLVIAANLNQLSFGGLMEVYIEGNLEKARDEYPGESFGFGLHQAEQDFYQYLSEVFFPTPGARYAIWEENGKYISALRLEPYKDGLLISALETAPEYRRKGYAVRLLNAVLAGLRGEVYSHVSKGNLPSLKTHEKCGFQRIRETAVYLDGSINPRACTMHIHV